MNKFEFRLIGGVTAIIGGVTAMAIGFMLYGPVQKMEPRLVYLIGILGSILLIGLITTYGALRDAGLLGVTEEYREDYEEETDTEKEPQTYEQYVVERLRIERVMRYGWLGRII